MKPTAAMLRAAELIEQAKAMIEIAKPSLDGNNTLIAKSMLKDLSWVHENCIYLADKSSCTFSEN